MLVESLQVTLQVVKDIQSLARAGEDEFRGVLTAINGRRISLCKQNPTIAHHLNIIASNGQLSHAEVSRQQLIVHLQGIEASCKLFDDKDAVTGVLKNVDDALQLLDKDRNLVRVETAYSHGVACLVDASECVFEQMSDFLIEPSGEFTFKKSVADTLDDKSLEQFLERNKEKNTQIRTFNFASCPKLSVRAPVLMSKACPNLKRSYFQCICTDMRFHDQLLMLKDKEGKIELAVNREFLAHHSGYFRKLFTDPLGEKRSEPAVLEINLDDAEVIRWVYRSLTGYSETFLYALKQNVRLLQMATFLDCPVVIEEALELLIPAMSTLNHTDDLFLFSKIFLLLEQLDTPTAKKAKEALAEIVKQRLQQGATAFSNAFNVDFTAWQHGELECYFMLQELEKMAKVPGFPLPKSLSGLFIIKFDDLLKKIEESWPQEPFPVHLYSLVQSAKVSIEDKEEQQLLEKLITKIDSLSWKEQRARPSPSLLTKTHVMNHAMSFESFKETKDLEKQEAAAIELQKSADTMRVRIFKNRALAEIEALQMAFTEEQSKGLFYYFAEKQISKMERKDFPITPNFCDALGLTADIEAIEKHKTTVQKYPKNISIFLHTLKNKMKGDAKVFYLMGKLRAMVWHDRPCFPDEAGKYFTQALTIDPEYMEAKEALIKICPLFSKPGSS